MVAKKSRRKRIEPLVALAADLADGIEDQAATGGFNFMERDHLERALKGAMQAREWLADLHGVVRANDADTP